MKMDGVAGLPGTRPVCFIASLCGPGPLRRAREDKAHSLPPEYRDPLPFGGYGLIGKRACPKLAIDLDLDAGGAGIHHLRPSANKWVSRLREGGQFRLSKEGTDAAEHLEHDNRRNTGQESSSREEPDHQRNTHGDRGETSKLTGCEATRYPEPPRTGEDASGDEATHQDVHYHRSESHNHGPSVSFLMSA